MKSYGCGRKDRGLLRSIRTQYRPGIFARDERLYLQIPKSPACDSNHVELMCTIEIWLELVSRTTACCVTQNKLSTPVKDEESRQPRPSEKVLLGTMRGFSGAQGWLTRPTFTGILGP